MTPNSPGAWSPYDHAPPYRPRVAPAGESCFFTRQLEYIRPGLFEMDLPKVEPMKLAPLKITPPMLHYQPMFEPLLKYELAPDRSYVSVTGERVWSAQLGTVRVKPVMRWEEPLKETWTKDGRTVAVSGTFAQVRAWFEARGCTVKADRKPMRDASGYRVLDAHGRWVCDFISGWRSGRCTAHTDYIREGHDRGDE